MYAHHPSITGTANPFFCADTSALWVGIEVYVDVVVDVDAVVGVDAVEDAIDVEVDTVVM